MLVEPGVVEQRYRAVLEVLQDGTPVTEVARRYGVARQTVHEWLARYAGGGLGGLADRSSRPASCPHQMAAQVEARIVGLRRDHPGWGPTRILWELERTGTAPPAGAAAQHPGPPLPRPGPAAALDERASAAPPDGKPGAGQGARPGQQAAAPPAPVRVPTAKPERPLRGSPLKKAACGGTPVPGCASNPRPFREPLSPGYRTQMSPGYPNLTVVVSPGSSPHRACPCRHPVQQVQHEPDSTNYDVRRVFPVSSSVFRLDSTAGQP